ncbi:hypothetical protein CASFOL_027231 [Castilleja foliolosa]|uniref:Secreted protein n=1 Tax=Castilleja foliolosa TaxID=1961234 RepID=A0ABD3CE81_9LAMI
MKYPLLFDRGRMVLILSVCLKVVSHNFSWRVPSGKCVILDLEVSGPPTRDEIRTVQLDILQVAGSALSGISISLISTLTY